MDSYLHIDDNVLCSVVEDYYDDDIVEEEVGWKRVQPLRTVMKMVN